MHSPEGKGFLRLLLCVCICCPKEEVTRRSFKNSSTQAAGFDHLSLPRSQRLATRTPHHTNRHSPLTPPDTLRRRRRRGVMGRLGQFQPHNRFPLSRDNNCAKFAAADESAPPRVNLQPEAQ
ncbi:hypothetical protein E2C01_069779 [Portunus trituberculatus]|uniref:Uncharacterized protein n=1 Tax=Portunus trituberculatus TaxID=210409 RepID=A0A5B7HVG8_PORTR|nr:hypothetical protein [Portunus trituberculatus]